MAPKAKAKEESAPAQQSLEEQPLVSDSETATSYGNFSARMKGVPSFPTPKELDEKMPKKMRDLCNKWIVDTYQFDEMENAGGALMCARFLRMFLIFFIVTSTFGLIIGFVLKASLAAAMESEQYSTLSAPSVVVCASPWGTDFLGFQFQAAQQGLVPGIEFTDLPSSNWTFSNFDANKVGAEDSEMWLSMCRLVQLNDVMLKPHGKVAQYTAFETIRLAFNAQSEDGKFNFGFCNGDNEMPQRWYYGTLGSRLSGEIMYDQVNVGASDVSEGIPRSILNWKSTGEALLGSTTELEYFYGYFMVRVLAAQAKGLSVFACVAFILLVAAAVNNCGLFELFFVEYVPDDEPPPALVPNILCMTLCGQMFSSCRLRQKKVDGDEVEAEADPEEPPAKPPPPPIFKGEEPKNEPKPAAPKKEESKKAKPKKGASKTAAPTDAPPTAPLTYRDAEASRQAGEAEDGLPQVRTGNPCVW